MQLTRGSVVARTDGKGDRSLMRVRVVRYGPIPYAEIEPLDGGDRRAVLLTDLERDYQLE